MARPNEAKTGNWKFLGRLFAVGSEKAIRVIRGEITLGDNSMKHICYAHSPALNFRAGSWFS